LSWGGGGGVVELLVMVPPPGSSSNIELKGRKEGEKVSRHYP